MGWLRQHRLWLVHRSMTRPIRKQPVAASPVAFWPDVPAALATSLVWSLPTLERRNPGPARDRLLRIALTYAAALDTDSAGHEITGRGLDLLLPASIDQPNASKSGYDASAGPATRMTAPGHWSTLGPRAQRNTPGLRFRNSLKRSVRSCRCAKVDFAVQPIAELFRQMFELLIHVAIEPLGDVPGDDHDGGQREADDAAGSQLARRPTPSPAVVGR